MMTQFYFLPERFFTQFLAPVNAPVNITFHFLPKSSKFF